MLLSEMDRLAGIVARLPTHRETQRRVQELIAEERCVSRRYCWRRRQRDPMYAVVSSLRTRIRNAALSKAKRSVKKADRLWGLVGCTRLELQAHLERQFKQGMSWLNYGQWHIDHIRPCCSFDLRDPEQQYACFHFSNLQPLWAVDNLRKQGRYDAA